jgi:ABC-type ATPase with predicted acetyltransferase domain
MRYLKEFIVTPENQSLLVAEAFGIQEGWQNKIVDVELPDVLPPIVLITGESGCGKSTLLKMLGSVTDVPIPDTPLHAWAETEEKSLRLLNAVGLNDASLFVLRFNQLSDSQQARAKMYLYLCQKLKTLFVDEFLSTLDRKTAKALAFSFQKTLRKEKVNLIAATAHEDLSEYLQPDLLVVGRAFPSRWIVVENQSVISKPFQISIEQRDKSAYREHTLGEIHYKGKYTGGKQEYLSASIDGEIVGWLVGKILPGTSQHRISRVVVHPTYRGCGVGQLLIGDYMRLHPDCDTVAAMARFNPVFERAGMTRVKDVIIIPPSQLKSIPLTSLQWASKQACFDLMAEEKYRVLVAPFASTQYVNPGGSLNGNKDRKTALSVLVKTNQSAAAAVLWGLRPRTMAKYVGPKHKEFCNSNQY